MYKYDFGLSFAGEDREYAKKIAKLLKDENIRVFYDEYEEADLWGQDLYQKFQQIYGQECRFFIPFVSSNYISKLWPQHELKQAQARDFKSNVEYILPLRIDDATLPGINDTTAYVDLRKKTIEQVVQLCLNKLVRDSKIRQLFIFLRENNPEALKVLKNKPEQILIRVSTNKVLKLEQILSETKECNGINHHTTATNGGFGPAGCIPSNDAEPHTTFTLSFTEAFHSQINL